MFQIFGCNLVCLAWCGRDCDRVGVDNGRPSIDPPRVMERKKRHSVPSHVCTKVESSRQGLAAAASRMGAPRWCSQLAVANNTCGGGDGGGNGGNGHRSFLFELFEIRRAHSHETTTAATTPHSQALASLLGEKDVVQLGLWLGTMAAGGGGGGGGRRTNAVSDNGRFYLFGFYVQANHPIPHNTVSRDARLAPSLSLEPTVLKNLKE